MECESVATPENTPEDGCFEGEPVGVSAEPMMVPSVGDSVCGSPEYRICSQCRDELGGAVTRPVRSVHVISVVIAEMSRECMSCLRFIELVDRRVKCGGDASRLV